MKLAVVGGGSTYTPELVSGLARDRDLLDLRQLVLHDIDAERREVVGGMAQRMLGKQGYDGTLELTDDLDRAVAEHWGDSVDLDLAGTPDRQGIGGPSSSSSPTPVS